MPATRSGNFERSRLECYYYSHSAATNDSVLAIALSSPSPDAFPLLALYGPESDVGTYPTHLALSAEVTGAQISQVLPSVGRYLIVAGDVSEGNAEYKIDLSTKAP